MLEGSAQNNAAISPPLDEFRKVLSDPNELCVDGHVRPKTIPTRSVAELDAVGTGTADRQELTRHLVQL